MKQFKHFIVLFIREVFLTICPDLAKAEVTAFQFCIMKSLARGLDENMTKLARRFGVTTSNVTGFADRLEKLGYGNRVPVSGTCASYEVRLTPQGKLLVSSLTAKLRDEIISRYRFWDCIPEKETCLSLVERIVTDILPRIRTASGGISLVQLSVLHRIISSPQEKMLVADLGHFVGGGSYAAAARHSQRLERFGYAQRSRIPSDRTRMVIAITEDGKKFIKEQHGMILEILGEYLIEDENGINIRVQTGISEEAALRCIHRHPAKIP